MIFDWLDEQKTPGLTKSERLMGVLFDLGMATADQLQVITGWSKRQLKDAREGIRSKGKSGEPKAEEQLLNQMIRQVRSIADGEIPATEHQLQWIRNGLRALAKSEVKKDEWLRFYTTFQREVVIYTLGSQGNRYVADLLGRTLGSYRELSPGQRLHTVGTTEILVRLLRAGIRPQQWLNTRETTDRLKRIREQWNMEPDGQGSWEVKREYIGPHILPDASVQIEDQWYWIEYDRGSKTGEKIRDQLDQYIQLRAKLGKPIDPVVWVTPNVERTEELRDRIYPKVLAKYPESFPVPTMYFFTEGEETELFVNGEGKKTAEVVAGASGEAQLSEEIQRIQEERAQMEEQVQELRTELERKESRIEYLTRMVEENQRGKSELENWIRGLVEHLQNQQGGFLSKVTPAQSLEGFVQRRGIPEGLEYTKSHEL